MSTSRFAALALVTLMPLLARAFSPTGLTFTHRDWELACDNTGTCRAAGYHSDINGENSVSILLTRHAGPKQPVTAQVMLGKYGDNEVVDSLPATFALALKINGKALGRLAFDKKSLRSTMAQEQVSALVTALSHRAEIQMELGFESWRVSDRGATAVLLKMDEYQGRLDTPGALIRKGMRPEAEVPPRQLAPRFRAIQFAKPLNGDKDFVVKHGSELLQAIRSSVDADTCEDLQPESFFDDDLTAMRLDASHMLISARCWLAPYNRASGYWIVQDKPPFNPELVTTEANEIRDGKLVGSSKGRGLGDCWSYKTWGWDGKAFQVIAEYSTGMCRLIAPGGPWVLPTIVTEER